jgi:SAM-dependent methyltransferase
MTGVDGSDEVIRITKEMYPELTQRVLTSDLRKPLPFEGDTFDFVLCVSVLQHIEALVIHEVTLPELARVLRPDGLLLLAFKRGRGSISIYDQHYEQERHFLLHNEIEMLRTINTCGMDLVHSSSPNELGGLMYCSDVKGLRYCAFFARKHPAQVRNATKNQERLH